MGISERWKGFNELPDNWREKLSALTTFFKEHSIQLAYLFGSAALTTPLMVRDSERKINDLDIAVWIEEKDLSEIRKCLYETIGSERIDLINLKYASPLVQFEIVKEGKLIYKVSDEIENQVELTILQIYQDTVYWREYQNKILEERLQDGSKTTGHSGKTQGTG